MDSFDIISYSSVTKCRVQYHSYLNNTISTIHFFFLLKMYFLAAIMSKNTNKKIGVTVLGSWQKDNTRENFGLK